MGFVGKAISADSGTAAASVTVTYSPVNGNNVRGCVTFGDGVTFNNVQDNNSVSATLIDFLDDAARGQAFQTFYFKSVSGSPTSFTAHFSGSTGGLRIMVQEWSGEDPSAPLDKHVIALSALAAATSGNVTPTVNGEDIYGCITVTSILTETITASGSYTLRNDGSSAAASNSCADESQTQGTAAAIAATFTLGAADNSIVAIATFKQASGAAFPKDWQVPPFQPPSRTIPPSRAGALMRGHDGIDARFVWFQPNDWDVHPPQPPARPVPAGRNGAIMRGDEGIQFPWIRFIQNDWDTHPHQPQHPRPERAGTLFGGDQSTEAPFIKFFPYGWELQQFLMLPRYLPNAKTVPEFGHQGIDSPYVPPLKVTWGWEIASPQPPRFPSAKQRYPGIRGSSQFPIWSTWINYGWDIPSPQPPHPRPERAGAIATSEPGIEAVFVPPVLNPWGWDVPSWQPPVFTRHSFAGMVRGGDGTEFPLIRFQPNDWDVHPFQPPHPRPERFAALVGSSQGSEATLILFRPYGWEIPSPQPPHPRPERAGSIMLGDPGNENVFSPPIVYPEGWQIQPWQPPGTAWRLDRLAGIVRGQDGTEFPLIRFLPTGWEIAPHQPQHPRPERAALLFGGDQGTESPFVLFRANDWDTHPFQPPHPRPERAGAIMPWEAGIEAVFVPPVPITWGWEQSPLHLKQPTVSRYFGIEGSSDFASFSFLPYGWEIAPPQSPHPRPERGAPVIVSEPGIEAKFVPPPPTVWAWEVAPFQPPAFTRKTFAGMIRGQDGTDFPLIRFLPYGWEVPPFQPPHRAPEWRAATFFRGDDGNQYRLIVPFHEGWHIPPFQPPHPRFERFGSVVVGHQGTDAVYVFVPPPVGQVNPFYITLAQPRVTTSGSSGRFQVSLANARPATTSK